MSAVIWLGIVAVWAFVLIPTWVRRSDIHWRRSGDSTSTRDKLGRAARVIRSGGRRQTGGGVAVPAMRRPASTTVRRATVSAASASRSGRSTTLLKSSVEEATLMDAQTETRAAGTVDEPPTRQIPAVGRRAEAGRVHADRARAEPGTTDRVHTDQVGDDADADAPSAQAADVAEPEAPMTAPRTPRPIPRRTAPAQAKAAVPPHVQRARRLVWIGATALATLLLAFVFRGWWILFNLVADLALFAYLRYLRGIAKQQLARKARAQTARADARAPQATERAAPVRAEQRRAAPRHRADAPSARPPRTRQPVATRAAAPARTTSALAPDVIDLTDEALSDDCPTTELTVARAV